MNLEQFFNQNGNQINFTREQASQFAKMVADDFNPIHDVDAKRFCVPGDLLFAVALTKKGLSEKIHVTFSDMVGNGIDLSFQKVDEQHTNVIDEKDKTYLKLATEGQTSHDEHGIKQLIEQYVAFSGKTFPHVLVPLWKDKNVMVNPNRPLVIYESMSLNMQSLDFTSPTLSFSGSSLEVNGKRGNVSLQFEFKEDDRLLGTGEKRMILSGLKEYDQNAIDELISFYNQRKETMKT